MSPNNLCMKQKIVNKQGNKENGLLQRSMRFHLQGPKDLKVGLSKDSVHIRENVYLLQ